MIKYDPKTWFTLIFHQYSRHALKVLMPALLFMLVYTTAIVYLIDYFEISFQSTTAFHSLLGIVLGLFLVFRMNSAYDRWWEGRKHWGALVNNTRNLAFKLETFLPEGDHENRKYFRDQISNFIFAFKEHLRQGVKYDEMEDVGGNFMEELRNADHKPNFISTLIYKRINELYKQGVFSGDQLFLLDKEVKSFSDILGACERIKNTPIPYSYSMYIKKFIFTYIITLPFGFVTTFYYVTIPIVVLLFYILVSIELIAEEIEDPFGTDVNDLPTDNLCDKIRANISEVMKVA